MYGSMDPVRSSLLILFINSFSFPLILWKFSKLGADFGNITPLIIIIYYNIRARDCGVSLFNGMERWNGMVEWNGGMEWNGIVE